MSQITGFHYVVSDAASGAISLNQLFYWLRSGHLKKKKYQIMVLKWTFLFHFARSCTYYFNGGGIIYIFMYLLGDSWRVQSVILRAICLAL